MNIIKDILFPSRNEEEESQVTAWNDVSKKEAGVPLNSPDKPGKANQAKEGQEASRKKSKEIVENIGKVEKRMPIGTRKDNVTEPESLDLGKVDTSDIDKAKMDAQVNGIEPTYNEYGISPETASRIMGELKGNQGLVNDYFGDSLSDMWTSLSEKDKKFLVLDQIGTSLKNLMKYQPTLTNPWTGQAMVGQDMGDEKSLIQQGIKSSFEKGLERRNKRLDTAMEEQLKLANFPAEQQMKLRDYWKTLEFNNKAKVDLVNKMSNVEYMTALRAYLRQNPHVPIEDAFRTVDVIISGAAAIRGGGTGGSTAGSSNAKPIN